MEKREDALREALGNNEEEIQKWDSYIKENETAINNLNMFGKKLTVDVLVPVAKRAYMSGRLIHTNEVLVGHYQDYFSKCSANTAAEICKRRIENGKQHLQLLGAERDLFKNKLEKPYMDGVLPNSKQREIIEEYDEEKEKIWKKEHRQRVKEAKLKEKQQRLVQEGESAHDDLIQALEEEELLKELNEELAEREIEPNHDTEEILNKLMSGKIDLPPPKKRIAHTSVKRHDSVLLNPIETKTNISTAESVNTHNTRLSENKLNSKNNSEVLADENDSDTSIYLETPQEIRLLEQHAAYLPLDDQITFYQFHLQIVDQKIATHLCSNEIRMDEKSNLFEIRYHLEELIETLQEDVSSETDSQATDIDKKKQLQKILESSPKRRISFALEDQMLEFKKSETVAQMIPIISQTGEKPQRDIIRLHEPILAEDRPLAMSETDLKKPIDRRKTILEKVEENLKTQNFEDNDLLNKIKDSSTNQIQTLHIHFKHSTEVPVQSDDVKPETPTSPADLYKMVCSKETFDPQTTKDTNFYLKEADRQRAYVDFLSPASIKEISKETQSKSILKNKSSVERETHNIEIEEKPKPQQKRAQKPKETDEYLSAYNKVMNDVIENPSAEPDPLPGGKFVDMRTPKKRISRFKQMRNENK